MATTTGKPRSKLHLVRAFLTMLTSSPFTLLSMILPLVSIFVFLPSVPAAVVDKGKLTVLPFPTHSTTGDTPLCLTDDFRIRFGQDAPEDLSMAIRRTEEALRNSRHRYLSVGRGKEFFASSNSTDKLSGCKHHLSSLVLTLSSSALESRQTIPSIFDSATRPAEDRPELEAYRLSIPLTGPARIEAKTALGLFRGLTTFELLFYHLPLKSSAASSDGQVLSRPDSLSQSEQLPLGSGIGSSRETAGDERGPAGNTEEAGRVYAPFAPYEIEDKPAFGWRAVLRDTSRNYFSVESILKMLDTMAMVKLNVFHWHITDSNSWPLDLSAFPELAARGAYSSSEIYSEANVKMIIRYAGERGIDVVMEIDTPAHTAVIAEAYPDYIACYERSPWSKYALQPPAGQLRFANAEVMDFTSRIMSAAAGLTSSVYFGTGGDEFNQVCMLEDESTTQLLEANGWTLNDAIDQFTAKTHGTLRQARKTPVVWQEMVLDHGPMPSIGKDTIIDIWVNSEYARRVLDKGFRIVHASADYFYLDCGQGGWIVEEGGSNSWCDPFKTWARMYSFDPYKDVEEEQRKLVLGGQTSLWAEQTDETNVESVIWPRAAAVAEVFWSGAGANGYPRSSIEALPRIHDIRYRMVDRGVQAAPLQPHWCALRPGVCVAGG